MSARPAAFNGARTEPETEGSAVTTPTTPFLTLASLRSGYGGTPVVDGLSLEVIEGEFLSLLGPSGCGKTTLLHLIAGFQQPDAGDILIQGASVLGVPSHRRGVAMVFQSYALFPHMSVWDNVAFGLRMQHRPRAEIRERVAQALEMVELSDFGRRLPDALSGGQRQRVALARALVLRPRLLLLDEPLSNLDAALRQSLREEFQRIHRLTGMTTIMVTHDLEEAFAASDRVAVLAGGHVQQVGTPREVYARPATAFVADYLRLGNRIHGALQAADRHRMQMGALQVRVPETARAEGPVAFAIPEQALRLQAAAAGADNRFAATLRSLVYLGGHIRFDLAFEGLTLRGHQPAGPWMQGLQAGQGVQVGWDVQDMIALPQDVD